MTKSILEQVIDEFSGKIEKISKTSGYSSDLGEHVSFNAPSVDLQEPSQSAHIRVMSEAQSQEDSTIGARLNEITIFVFIVTKSSPFSLISDLKLALIPEDQTTISADTMYLGFEREDISTSEVEVYQTIWTVQYYEAWSDPYSTI